MSLPIAANAISPVNAERLAAPPRAIDPSAANPGAQKAPVARATGGEDSVTRTLPLLSVKQSTQSEKAQKNLPAGPTPSFEESVLERQARVALEYPPVAEPVTDAADAPDTTGTFSETLQAEAGFAEARTLEDASPPPTLDLRG